MADSAQIPLSLQDLGDAIRAIERESGQPSQLVVIVGDDKYLVGDLRKRAGEYRLEMQDEYDSNPFERGKKTKNPHKRLAGNYKSFDALSAVIKSLDPNSGRTNDIYESPHLIGSPDQGYSPAVQGINMGSTYGQTYNIIGKIIFPLLQDGEPISIDKVES